MSERILTVECRVCGGPVNHVIDEDEWAKIDSPLQRLLMAIAQKGSVHDACFSHRGSKEDINLRIAQRAADFRLLCPPQYHTSGEWIKTPEAAKTINLKALAEAMAWKCEGVGINLHGKKSGTGKTTTAYLICEREHAAGKFIVALTHKELSDKATLAAQSMTPELKRWMTSIRNCDLLFIDDLGKARFKSKAGEGRASEEMLFDVVDHRATNNLPTIITINMEGKELATAMSGDKGVYFIRRLRDFFTRVNFDKNI